ncbi:proton-coupled amino acid transporter-like protein pathetic [Bombyx mandarina]|uniref:Proton-coupled amino acid transporter-like protein pathetic n=1 Tax=Bombyx mandarina TaxID=7092 RepID=A0A6J2KHL7_BOMMA|nr:proton-coupled amino acid transporter-like protein pathetic [Bombyx mandarina]
MSLRPDNTKNDMSKRISSSSIYSNRGSLSTNLNQYLDFERDSSVATYELYPGTETDNYDFTVERHSPLLYNLFESTAYLIKGFFGAGILNVHVAYMFAGLWTSLVVTFVMGGIICRCMMLLVKSAHKMYVLLRVPRLTYADLVEAVVAIGPLKKLRNYSKTLRYFVDICLFVQMCGTCCIYEIIIATTLKKVLEAVSPTLSHQELHLRIYVMITMVPLIAVCLIRNMRYLAPFSLLADLFIGICMAIALYYGMSSAVPIRERPAWKNYGGLIRGSSIILYALSGITATLPVENNMERPKLFFIVLQYGMSVVLCLVTVTGFFGYWGFGENCQGPITVHMGVSEVFPLILQFKLILMLCVTFGVKFWVPFRLVWYYLGKLHNRGRKLWERIYMMFLIILITGITTLVPNLTSVMVFMGSFLFPLTAIIFPALIDSFAFWNEYQKERFRWKLTINIMSVMIAFTIVGSAFCLMFIKV